MDMHLENELDLTTPSGYQLALTALKHLPDHSVVDMGELAERIGADKLELITWVRADIKLARLIAAKLAK